MQAFIDQGVEIRSDSKLMFNFCMPPEYEANDITIGYTPWESTEVPKTWTFGLRGVDELWTTSSWTASIFQQYRNDEIFILPHGIEKCWKPVLHTQLVKPFTFLHVGEPAERKGGDIVLEAWWKHFRTRKDCRLIYKCIKYPSCRIKDDKGSIIGSPESISNVSTITNIMTQRSLHELYCSVNALVYPTRGEGFGLIPFEAMATGLPTILPGDGGTYDFCEYSPYVLRNSKWVNSDEQLIHPGQWLEHDLDELIYLMELVMNDYVLSAGVAYESALEIHKDYTWKSIAEIAVDRFKLYI